MTNLPGQRTREPAGAHDHAWRRSTDEPPQLLLGEYACDLCGTVWSL